MSSRSTDSVPTNAWPVDEPDVSIDFAEYSEDADHTGETATTRSQPEVAAEAVSEVPTWFRPKTPATAPLPDEIESESRQVQIAAPTKRSKGPKRGKSRNRAASGPQLIEVTNNDSSGQAVGAGTQLLQQISRSLGVNRFDKSVAAIEADGDSRVFDLFKAWLLSREFRSYYASIAVHAVLLLVLSVVILEQLDDNDAITTIITDSNNLPFEFDEIMDLKMAAAGGAEQTQLPQLQQLPVDPTKSLLQSRVAASVAQLAGDDDGQNGEAGSGLMFRLPTGGKAVTKGSFTAWTVPKDPEPGEDYKIVIVLKLPESSRRYRIRDLTGKVVGTDGFELEIPFERFRGTYGTRVPKLGKLSFPSRNDFVRPVDGKVQIVVDVPAAGARSTRVRDRIEVASKMLKEDQTLEIEF